MDVYSEWVDACDAVAKDNKDGTGDLYQSSHRNLQDRARSIEDNDVDKDVNDGDGDGYVGEGIVADDEY